MKGKRALRRHHANRIKARVSKWGWVSDDPATIGIIATTPKRCGKHCPCCETNRKPVVTKQAAINEWK